MPKKRKKLSAQAVGELHSMKVSDFAKKYGLTMQEVKEERQSRSISGPPKGPRKPLKKSEIKLLGKMSDADVAQRIGRASSWVSKTRHDMGIKPFGKPRGELKVNWTKTQLGWLGKKKDTEIARAMGIDPTTVAWKRRILGIEGKRPVKRKSHNWKKSEIELLGKITDKEMGDRIGFNRKYVLQKRLTLGKASFASLRSKVWQPEWILRLGKWSDKRIAKELGCPLAEVKQKRESLKLPPK